MLSINDDEGEDVDDDDYEYEAMEPVSVQSRTLLTGGGGSNTSDSEDGLEEDFTAVIYTTCDVKLKHSEAAEMLDNPDSNKLSTFLPYQPKGGSMFLFSARQQSQNKDDWRADGYTWRTYGKSKVTNGDKIIEKSYFRIKNGKK